MQYRILIALAFTFISFIGNTQESYHRLYETTMTDTLMVEDTIFFHMSSTTTSGDVIAMGTKRVGSENLSIIFTKHDNKGNEDWSSELDLGDTVTIIGTGNIAMNSSADSILFAIHASFNGDQKEVFGRLSTGGGDINLTIVGGNQFATLTNSPNVSPLFNNTDLVLTPGERPTLSRIGLDDDLQWSRTYQFTNTDGDEVQNFVSDIKFAPDSTIVIAGTVQGEKEFMVSKLDSNGVQLWAESYAFSDNNITRILPTEAVPLMDGSVAIVGDYLTNGIMSNGFVAVVDTMGDLIFAKKLYLTENLTSIRNVIEGDDGSLWMSGVYLTPDSTRYFTANMGITGVVNWTTVYGEQESIADYFTTDLINVNSTGGATLIGHGFKDDLQVLQVMKHNNDGTTACSDTITSNVEDLMIISDTLVSEVINGGLFFDSLGYELSSFDGFSPPILTIQPNYQPFCPNEIIDTFLFATVSQVAEENISYLWSTESINDTIPVMEDGQYSVTVTITEDVCYMMCDTIELTRYMLPMVDISQDNAPFCETATINLQANYTPGAPGQTFLWSTGETTPLITVDTEGPISVTVTDECGFTANVTEDVTIPMLSESAEITFEVTCDEDDITNSRVIFSAIGDEGAEIFLEVYDGSNNLLDETNPSRDLPLGVYLVVANDACGLLDSLTINTSAACGGFLQYPIAFFPSGQDDNSRTFGPIPNDTMDIDRITEVEFKVFNRWGETVFESDAILDAWDGTHKGDPAPSEVYIWYVSYMLDGEQMLDKGDVTLLR